MRSVWACRQLHNRRLCRSVGQSRVQCVPIQASVRQEYDTVYVDADDGYVNSTLLEPTPPLTNLLRTPPHTNHAYLPPPPPPMPDR